MCFIFSITQDLWFSNAVGRSPLMEAHVWEMSRQGPASLVVSENCSVSPEFLDIFLIFQPALNMTALWQRFPLTLTPALPPLVLYSPNRASRWRANAWRASCSHPDMVLTESERDCQRSCIRLGCWSNKTPVCLGVAAGAKKIKQN